MRVVIWAAMLFMALSSCGHNPSLSDAALPEDTMKAIVVDLAIVDAAYGISLGRPGYPTFRPEFFYEKVLEKHHVSRDAFLASLQAYAQQPKKLQLVYEQALSELSTRQTEANR